MKKNNKQIAIYQAPSGAVEVRLDTNKETIFLTQQQVGDLFNVQKTAISKHIKNIFETGELDKKKQLFPFWKQFKLKETAKLPEKLSITIWI